MEIFWIKCFKTTETEIIDIIKKSNKPLKIFTPNPEIMLHSKKDKSFRECLIKADYLLPDWIWLYLAYQILEDNSHFLIILLKLPLFVFNLLFKKDKLYEKYWEKITWSHLTKKLLEEYNKIWWNIWILDLYTETDIKKIESQKLMPIKLKERYPNINFTIVRHQKENIKEEIETFNKNKCDVIFCSLWMVKQELAISKILPYTAAKAWLWIGWSLDYFIGFQKEAPAKVKKAWFEWLYRLITYPKKLVMLKKIWRAVFVFTYFVLKEKYVQKNAKRN